MFKNNYINEVFNNIKNKNIGQNEYIQACQEILESLELVIDKNPKIKDNSIFERFFEPESMI